MRRWFTLLGATLLFAALSVPASAASTVQVVQGRLVDTHAFGIPADQLVLEPGNDPGTNWASDGIWHMRSVPVTDTIESLDGSVEMGQLVRSVNFNLNLATGASTAWCSFTMTLTDPDLGVFDGHCAGTLLDGTVTGNGPNGHLRGIYYLESGGIPSIGPYVIELEIAGG